MTRLDLLDPTHAGDARFDPDGAQARRVRTAALRPHAPPARRRARPRLAIAGIAAAAAVAIVVTVGTSTAPPDARAALQQAAERTGSIDSGRVAVSLEGESPGNYKGATRTEIRFQGDDLEAVVRGRESFGGGPVVESARTIRLVGGIAYERDDSRPGARFRTIGKVDPVTFGVTGQMDDEGLVELVRGARDVEAEEAGGVTTYRGTTTAGAVEDAAPTARGRARGGAWDRQVALEVAVGEDGLIRHVIVRDAKITRTTRYADLGEPQTIRRP